MRSLIKIYGPPVLDAIRALEKVAVEMPEVCIMDSIVSTVPEIMAYPESGSADYVTGVLNYFSSRSIDVSRKRCGNIISKSGEMLGRHDFFFEWFQDPSTEKLNELIEKIDEALTPLGCLYTITTRD